MLVDRDAFGEVLRLAYPDLAQPVDDQVIDLRGMLADLDPQVVDDRPVRGPTEVQVDEVGRVLLTFGARLNPPHLGFDAPSHVGLKV